MTIDWISSRSSSSWPAKPPAGASSESSTFSGTPALEPGVKITASWLFLRAAISGAPSPQSARPFFQAAAVSAAAVFTSLPSRRAAPASIQGSNDAASWRSKSSSRLARSPFGSIAITGTPWRSSSSRITTARPVLPDPVMPTISPWVRRSSGSSSIRSPGEASSGSTFLPMYSPWPTSYPRLCSKYLTLTARL